LTWLPDSGREYADRGEDVAEVFLGQKLPPRHALRQAATVYQNAAGIELGYGFFAPAVPNSCKLVFELHYPDGRIDYDLPRAHEGAGGSRLVRFLDQIGRLEYEPLRETMLEMLVHRAWQKHPGASSIRAVFGFIQLPTPAEVRRGQHETYRFMYAYDFSLRRQATEQQNR
jgi:hypothetical protein